MSDPKRANLITVGAPTSGKNIVNKTVRLTINLAESNESKYPELNYKELVIAEERKKRVENGKTGGLDPFFDKDDELERAAKQFEQKYGNNSTYGKKKKISKHDDFADIGAGYDENDSFIDNTDGYDEMIPPDIDTYLGGFYINCGSLEFKTVPHNSGADESNRNKRRISSSSSSEESSDSSSGSVSRDTKEAAPPVNTLHDTHKTEHRKKKNKKVDKQKATKVRRVDSSAATSGKQTSDDNIQPEREGESVDSRTSHSDSLTSKPAPSSENAITSDSSRDTETKADVQLPPPVTLILETLEASVAKHLSEQPVTTPYSILNQHETQIQKLEAALRKCDSVTSRVAMQRAAQVFGVTRACLARLTAKPTQTTSENAQPSTNTATATTATTTTTTTYTSNKNKRKLVEEDDLDVTLLTNEQREAMILDIIRRLMDLIEEFKPSMFANYNMECERVREEKKKLSSDGATVDKRLPKRRFPWCHRSRTLLSRLTRLAGPPTAAAALLAERVLPLFPKGFVRMPTLMRQANISKDIKVPEMKRQRLGSTTQIPTIHPLTAPTAPQIPTIHPLTAPTAPQLPPSTPPLFSEQIQFPSSLTVTATSSLTVKTAPDKNDKEMPQIFNTFSLTKELVEREKNDKKEDIYIPPNNIGSITITPVPQKEKKTDKTTDIKTVPKLDKQIQKPEKPGLIRVKSPAALNESVKKDAKTKKPEKSYPDKPITKEKRIDTPLQIETNFQPTKKEPSPKNKDISPRTLETLSQKQIENLRVKENNIPRPALVPVHHSPTFAKPEKRPEKKKEEVKKKEIMIVSDMDPLSDQEPVAVDDSSSDVEVIENDRSASDVPSKDNKVPKNEADDDFDLVMKNIREMEHSQEPTKLNSNSFGGVITNSNAKHGHSYTRNGMLASRNNKDKFADRTSLNKTDGCNGVTG